MKLRYLFSTLIAGLALLAVGCTDDNDLKQLAEVQVSQSFVSIPMAGGSPTITLTATGDWSFDETTIPAWLTVSPMSGSAGETTVSFTAPEVLSGKGTVEVHIKCGDKIQHINVIQGLTTAEPSTCAEVNAGADGKTYQVTGVCTRIVQTTYGNWYLEDETGEVYVYGTLDAKGAAQNFLSLGLEVGDKVTVQGPKTTYNGTVELVDVTVVKIVKSLVKVESDPIELPIEGGDFSIDLTCKGDGLTVAVPDEAKSWLSVTGITTSGSTAKVNFNAAANAGGDRTITLVFNTASSGVTYSAQTSLTQKGSIFEVSIAEFNAAEVGDTFYKITGVVTKVSSDEKGRFYIKDYSGDTYIYGLYADGALVSLTSAGIEVGDIVTLVGKRGQYNTTIEALSSYVEAKTDVTEISIADILKKDDSKTDWFKVSGTVKSINDAAKGRLYLTDGTNDLYVYGCLIGYGATGDDAKLFGNLGVEVGGTLTAIGYKGSYNGVNELMGGIFLSYEAPVTATVISFTDASLPTAYAEEETTVSENDYSYYIYKVANYGNGIQVQGKKTAYIANKTPFKPIKTIKIAVQTGKTWYPDNLTLYAGTAEKPEATVITPTSDESGSTYDLSGSDYTFFKIVNTSNYSVYASSISIECK